jgi:hypothetical protein
VLEGQTTSYNKRGNKTGLGWQLALGRATTPSLSQKGAVVPLGKAKLLQLTKKTQPPKRYLFGIFSTQQWNQNAQNT